MLNLDLIHEFQLIHDSGVALCGWSSCPGGVANSPALSCGSADSGIGSGEGSEISAWLLLSGSIGGGKDSVLLQCMVPHLSNCGSRDLAGLGVLVLNTHSWSGALQTLHLLCGWLGSDPVLDGFGEAASLLLSLWGEAGSKNRCPT